MTELPKLKNDENEKNGNKIDEIVIKRGRFGSKVKIDVVDYRAFISFGLIGITAFFAYIGNDVWREFSVITGMAIAWLCPES